MPRGVEDLAAEELRRLGAADLQPTAGGISFTGDLAVAYRVLLESRLASRLLLPLWRVEAATSQVFYNAVSALPWERQLRRGATFAVDARARGDRAVHTHFVALRTKDAIVDRLRERWGERPDVDVDDPALRIHVLLDGGEAQLSIDLSGEPLHRRGYRGAGGPAPLKENVAAAMLLRAGWPAIAAAGGGFVDPMCGAGTLLVEAALLATDTAPGLLRTGTAATFGLRGWVGHDRRLWESLRAEAERRRQLGRARLPPMVGSDRDAVALERARASLAAAGIEGVELERADVGEARPPRGAATGL
ncbi:MAG TPA: THUMP domain-containing protein, partial [Thermoanaerobaculia bacterium]|nr:THUMP domain-containing protein [Thermoanaerobaculia bacterium]